MWPLNAQELVTFCNGQNSAPLHVLTALELCGTCSDSRHIQEKDVFIAIEGESYDGHNFVAEILNKHKSTVAIVALKWQDFDKLPENSQHRCVRVHNPLTAFRQFAKAFRNRFSFPVIGIGGSNGKTTTKEMLAAMLSNNNFKTTKTYKSQNGFLGLPLTLTQREHNIINNPHAAIVEIGIDTANTMAEHVSVVNPNMVMLTALGPEHLEGLGSWKQAQEEEMLLFTTATNTVRIWQVQDEHICKYLHLAKTDDTIVMHKNKSQPDLSKQKFNWLLYDLQQQPDGTLILNAQWIPKTIQIETDSQPTAVQLDIPMVGEHNGHNAALALGAAFAVGRTAREIALGWQLFVPPEMRSRLVTLKNGCVLYDDCYNANPASMQAALSTLKKAPWTQQKKVLILGDMLELGTESKNWHAGLVEHLKSLNRYELWLYGDHMYDVFVTMTSAATVQNGGFAIRHLKTSDDPLGFLKPHEPQVAQFFSDRVVLIKGSRGMHLERISRHLENICGGLKT